MYVVLALTRKELRLLLRDRMAAGLLVGMPLLFILVLGLLLGENFGQKPDDTLKIYVVNLDKGVGIRGQSWANMVIQDLRESRGIHIETVPDADKAESLIRNHKCAAVLILGEDFSDRLNRCSFLDAPGSVNPFHREGVFLDPKDPNNPDGIDLGVRLLKDPMALSAAAIIEQVVQVCMLRIVLPYMIGEAFAKLSEEKFIDRLGQEVRLPMPDDFSVIVNSGKALLADPKVRLYRLTDRKMDATLKKLEGKLVKLEPYLKKDRIRLNEMIDMASGGDPSKARTYRKSVGLGVQKAIEQQFSKYDLLGMTWADLNRVRSSGPPAPVRAYVDQDGTGLLKRSAQRYQVLVPSYTVMFAFFLVLTVGWVFVSERRQGTLRRLQAAPVRRWQILLGKLLPCFLVSVGQGVVLLVAGRLLWGMHWGPDSWSLGEQAGWLLLVVVCTSVAAMGLALLVAAVARTEVQVALYGAVPVMMLALIGGCVLPREMMPAETQKLSFITPHGWALDAYRELLAASGGYEPNLAIVGTACAVLTGFGLVFMLLAWGLLRLD
jgi:ABC-2 type transport system permease protein